MPNPFTCAEARSRLIEALARDASLHEAGRYGDLGEGFDALDARFPRGAGDDLRRLVFAQEFWAGWLDSSAHGWLFYAPIEEADWPRLARTVVADLVADRPTTDPMLVGHFAPRPRRSSVVSRMLARLKGWAGCHRRP